MAINIENHSIFIKNSKLILGSIASVDRKRRTYEVISLDSKKNSFGFKDLIYDLEDNKLSSYNETTEISLHLLWNKLVGEFQTINLKEFIKISIDFFKLNNVEGLQFFLDSFNTDIIYFKIIDSEHLYINSNEVVKKISKNLEDKKNNASLNSKFIDLLSQKSQINIDAYDNQIEQLKNYLLGKKKYNKRFILEIKKELNFDNDYKLFNYLIDNKIFLEKTSFINTKLGLDNNFTYKLTNRSNVSVATLKAFTIDDESTKDYDDALSIEITENEFKISVHITNFSEFFNYESNQDLEARNRFQSIYSPLENFNLYDLSIIDDISLKEGKVRSVISIVFLTNNEYEIKSSYLEKNDILIDKNYSYSEAEYLFENDTKFTKIAEFARVQRAIRIENADFDEFNKDITFFIGEDNNLKVKQNDLESYQIVAELMILANSKAAEYMFNNEIPCIYRKQEESKNLIIDTFDTSPPFSFFRNVSQLDISTDSGPHNGLGLNFYTQFTSPIRRYYDSILMRQLDLYLKSRDILFSNQDIDKILIELSSRSDITKNKAKQLYKYWALKYMDQANIKEVDVYVYNELKSSYIIYFNSFNFYDSISKDLCRKTYIRNDKISIRFSSVDFVNLTFVDLEEVL
ncbi:MAG: RNB domain-containing ribonuclease [Candidatus Dadabacteria bacterium]|nr:RNB domain-containing ribonuclease [Candidatus Dadabacteria bacterium]